MIDNYFKTIKLIAKAVILIEHFKLSKKKSPRQELNPDSWFSGPMLYRFSFQQASILPSNNLVSKNICSVM